MTTATPLDGTPAATVTANDSAAPVKKPVQLTLLPGKFDADETLDRGLELAEAILSSPRPPRIARQLAELFIGMNDALASGEALPKPWKPSVVRAERRRKAALAAKARASDPSTSKSAAASITTRKLRVTQAAVLNFMSQSAPLTQGELVTKYRAASKANSSLYPRQSDSGLRTRLRELADLGLVRNTGSTKRGPSGRPAIIWTI